jgi:D-arabinose 1-dehydrogenase-like Zn-dependent alcohol dehydrogenase
VLLSPASSRSLCPWGRLREDRAAYGWQRDGGHAEYLLAEESTCIQLPDELSYLDGACVACGFSTAYEALRRAGVSGADAVLVTGMGPVGLAAGSSLAPSAPSW